MKAFLLSVALLMLSALPAFAQTATPSASPSPSPQVMGIYDTEWSDAASGSASTSATPRPTATPQARTTQNLDPSDAPVSGAVENTIALLGGGSVLIFFGLRFTRS